MRDCISEMQHNVFHFRGSGNVPPLITIDIRTNSGRVLFTHVSEKNSLKETIELFLTSSRGGTLENVNLSNLDLSGVNLNNARFINSRFDNSIFYGSEICSSHFIGCSFNGSEFYNTKVFESQFLRSQFFNSRFANLEFSSALFTNEVLRWLRENGQLTSLDGYKADLWMKLIKTKKTIAALREALNAGRIDGTYYRGSAFEFCGTIASPRGLCYNTPTGIRADCSSPVEQWFLMISAGMTPANSEVVRLALEWIDEFEIYSSAQ